MQLVADGPNIPEALLQAHEEGRVVFFCGAGISYPAGLPGFDGLVEAIYQEVGTERNTIEQQAYKRKQFDATLDLLERRLPGQRLAVRQALARVLRPNFELEGATDTHEALLTLARDRQGTARLVTTNFDRVFEYLRGRNDLRFRSFEAPLLPIPKNSRWDGVVYLHGLLPEEIEDDIALNRLVVTSGDFGLAYLTERWAARFVSELFRNYVVCFVGYSINDPILRYMMDALAADRMLGEHTTQAYAFGDYLAGDESRQSLDWKAKGVTPILYKLPADNRDHSALHRTLKEWAETYRDGVLGKERIVLNHAMARPSASTQQDDFVSRMLWALSDDSGLPARRFAELNPVPPLDWLSVLSADNYQRSDLPRFNVLPHTKLQNEFSFSLMRRPAPYTHTPWMRIASCPPTECNWDIVMIELARWLVRHLDDPELILWLAAQGGHLHATMAHLVDDTLDGLAKRELEGKIDELASIRANAPNAIPRPRMQTAWRLLLTNRVKSYPDRGRLYRWNDRLKREGLTATLRFELRELLAPKIALKRSFQSYAQKETPGVSDQRLVDFDLVLAADSVYSFVREQSSSEHWRNALPALFDDLQQLLRDALDLLCEVGDADERSDRSHWALPSIGSHWQNRGFRDWVSLIEVLRDSWLAVQATDHARAVRIAIEWFSMPYPTFKRLALFAASHDDCVAPDQWANWLVADDARWLWSDETMRETLRLLAVQGNRLPPQDQARLEEAIVAGPAREPSKDDNERQFWDGLAEHSVWLRLVKLQSSGAELGPNAAAKLAALSDAHPKWKVAKSQREEFSHWMSGSGDPDIDGERETDLAPRTKAELVEWLKGPPSHGRTADNWRETCSEELDLCVDVLHECAAAGDWPRARWQTALQAWSDEKLAVRSWQRGAPIVNVMPDEVLRDILNGITWWMEAVSKSLGREDEHAFVDLCRRILALTPEDREESDRSFTRAINHPVGHITEALINLWFRRNPNDNGRLPAELEPVFTELCDTKVPQFRHGRVILASNVIALFRVDRGWSEKHLLPLFDWTIDVPEARGVWDGFLWNARLYRPLLIAFKRQFLDTANHYTELDESARQFAAILTYAALEPADTFTTQELRAAVAALPQEGLNESARALVQALESSGQQREEYWANRIRPFWHDVWPKSRERLSDEIAETLAQLSILARGQFCDALDTIWAWLRRTERSDHAVRLLHKSGLANQFPEKGLNLLDAIIGEPLWVPPELQQCLDAISAAAPELQEDPRYKRLADLCRRRGA